MNDPQPTGYITLAHAYGLYHGTWPEPDELAEKQKLMDDHLEQFKYALAHDQLRARVRFPDREGEFDIPPQLWEVEGFPELEILREDIPVHSPDGWKPYVGRTLFVRESAFRRWLEHNGWQPPPDPKDFDDPQQMVTWTLIMTAAWIGTRDIDVVRWQMNRWREAHGWPHASLAVLAAGRLLEAAETEDADDADDPAHFESLAALKELTRQGEAGAVTAWARSSETGQPAQLQPSDWTYGKLEFDHALEERWRVGKVLYTDITFRRADIVEVWPAGDQSVNAITVGKRRPPLQQAIETAIAEHWPSGLPAFPSVKERNAAIIAKLGRTVSDDTFERYFSRA